MVLDLFIDFFELLSIMFLTSRVTAEPVLHHAVHLSKVRDLCKKNPLGMLKNYKSSAANDYKLLSLESLYLKLQQCTKSSKKNSSDNSGSRFLQGRNVSSSASTMTAPKKTEIDNEIGDFNFDDLETIEKNLDAKEIEKNAVDPTEKKTISKSIWASLTGGSKAAKFKA